jgi:hypothetical protein
MDCLVATVDGGRWPARKHGLTAEMNARFDMLLQCGF